MCRDDPAVFGRDHDAATGAAEATGRLVPLQFGEGSVGNQILCGGGSRQSSSSRCHGGGFQLGELAAVPSFFLFPGPSPFCWVCPHHYSATTASRYATAELATC